MEDIQPPVDVEPKEKTPTDTEEEHHEEKKQHHEDDAAEESPSRGSIRKDGDSHTDDGAATPETLYVEQSPEIVRQHELIATSVPTTELEKAMKAALDRKSNHISKLVDEIQKLRGFVSKRKQTYKRKRKDGGAPTRAMSGYNLFIKERFAQLSKQNEEALKSENAGAKLERVAPATLIAATGSAWNELTPEEKAQYDDRYVDGSNV
jgi:hypothetical protein